MTIHENEGVWFEPSGKMHTELIADDPDYRIKEGDWVVLLGRVHKVKRTGGYKRGQPPPGGHLECAKGIEPEDVNRHEQFQLDIAEVYLSMGIPIDEIKTHTRAVRRKRGMDRSGVQRSGDVPASDGHDPQTHPPTQAEKTKRS